MSGGWECVFKRAVVVYGSTSAEVQAMFKNKSSNHSFLRDEATCDAVYRRAPSIEFYKALSAIKKLKEELNIPCNAVNPDTMYYGFQIL